MSDIIFLDNRYIKCGIEDLASMEYEIGKQAFLSDLVIFEVVDMSIEWLLTKTTDINAPNRPSKSPQKEGGISGKDHGSKSRELSRKTEEDEERLRRAAYFSSAEMQNRHSEINLHCSCGYKGIVAEGKTDFKLLRTDKNGIAFFKCPNCKRHLRYNPSTGEIKIKKGFLGILPGKFS